MVNPASFGLGGDAYDAHVRTSKNFFPIRKPSATDMLHDRQQTDGGACVVFLVYILLMVIAAVYASFHGDSRRLTHGYDYAGRVCGIDRGVADLPFMYYCGTQAFSGTYPAELNFRSRSCVKVCPTANTPTVVQCLSKPFSNFSSPGQGFRNGIVTLSTSLVDITQTVAAQKSYPTRAHMSRIAFRSTVAWNFRS